MRAILLTLSILLISPLATAQPIYKTVDEQGRVSYSDKPPRGEEQDRSAELPPVNQVPAQQRTSPRQSTSPGPTRDDTLQYTLSLLSPQQDASVPPGQRDLTIAVQLQPALRPEHQLVYYLDGEPVAESRSTQHTIEEIYRGSHTIRVEALSATGQILGSTESVTVHVHRPTVNR